MLSCLSTIRPCAPDQKITTAEVCYAMPDRKARCAATLATTTGTWWRGSRRRQTWSSPSAWASTTPEPWTAAPTWASGTPWKVSQDAPPPPQPLCYEPFPPFDASLNLQASGIHRLVWETVPEWECTPLSTSSWTDQCLLCRVPQTTPYSFSTMLLLTGEASMNRML